MSFANVPDPRISDLNELPSFATDINREELREFQFEGSNNYSDYTPIPLDCYLDNLNDVMNMPKAWIEGEYGSDITATNLAARDGIATDTAVAGVNHLPAVTGMTNKTIDEINTLLSTREDFDGKPTDAIYVDNSASFINSARLSVNDGMYNETVSLPAESIKVKFLSESNTQNASSLESSQRLFSPSRLTPENCADAEFENTRFVIPLSSLFAFFSSENKIFPGMKYKISLSQESVFGRIVKYVNTHSETGLVISSASKIWIKSLRLYVPVVKLNQPAEQNYYKAILANKNGFLHSFESAEYYKSSPKLAVTQFLWNVKSENRQVSKIVAWVSRAGLHDSYDLELLSSSNKQHGNTRLTRLVCVYNGNQIPMDQYSVSFSATNSEGLHRAYQEFLNSGRKQNVLGYNSEPLMSFNDWKLRHNLFVFEVPADFKTVENSQNQIVIKMDCLPTGSAPLAADDDNSVGLEVHAVIFTNNLTVVSPLTRALTNVY